MEINYSPQLRIERIITIYRFVIVAFALFAVFLDPLDPPQDSILVSRILGAYLLYSSLLWLFLNLLPLEAAKIGIASHIIDILTFSFLVFITKESASPFFPYFVFTVFCSALRWQQRGVLWTALAFLFPIVGLGINIEAWPFSSDAEMSRLIIRTTHLIVIASLLIYLNTYERHMRKELDMLADWPSKMDASDRAESFLLKLLLNAARVMNAPRLLLIWDEHEESLRQIAYLQAGELQTQHISPDIFEPLVSADLVDCHFLCKQAGQPVPKVLLSKATERLYRSVSPLHPDLIHRFAIRQVIGLHLNGQRFHGRLLVLNKAGMISDDLTLGMLLAHQVTTLMDQRLAITDLKKAAAARERLTMARDLHDGLLQTLTGIALQIETFRRLFETDSQAAKIKLEQIQHLIVDEQRDLRDYIAKLKPPTEIPGNHQHNPAERLHRLAETIQQLWGIKVTLTLPPADSLQHLPEGLYNAVREGLINSARHAGATNVRVTISIEETGLRIFVSDNGKGFPFQGSYDLAALRASGLGPKSLMDRIYALRGQLTIDSGTSGAKLTMSVPLPDSQRPITVSSKASPGVPEGQNFYGH